MDDDDDSDEKNSWDGIKFLEVDYEFGNERGFQDKTKALFERD